MRFARFSMSITALAAVVAACGARTELLSGVALEEGDAATLDASPESAPVALDAATLDAELTDAGCARDSDCEDGIACTIDTCDLSLHECRRAANDAACDDGVFCDGTETCELGVGCASTPRSCDDGVACTTDTCDEATKTCDHAPSNAACPISQLCDAQDGCVALAFAVDGASLYDVRVPSGHYTLLGPTGGRTLLDIALHPDNVLYGVSSDALFRVDQSTGALTQVGPVSTPLNALDAAPDGTLYGAGGGTLYTVDRTTGATHALLAFPSGEASSGDLAFVGPRLLASASAGGSDDLVEFDLGAHTSRVIGSLAHTCVYGLAAYGDRLYGFTCAGTLLSIDPDTAETSEIAMSFIRYYGATAR